MLTSEVGRPRLLLLDTHIWIWASGSSGGPSRFAAWLAPKIESAARERRLFVSTASVWEIALKAQRGELLVAGELRTWVRQQQAHPGVRVLALNTNSVIEAVALPAWTRASDGKPHKDPNDRLIVSAARRKNAVLITCDELILDYARQGHVMACDARRER